MLHIKLKAMEHRAPCKHTYCLYTPLNPCTMQAYIHSLYTPSVPQVGSKGQTIFFLLKEVILHITLKEMEHVFLEGVMLHVKLKGIELRAPCNHLLCPYKYPQPVCQVKWLNCTNKYISVELKTVNKLLTMICMIPKVNL